MIRRLTQAPVSSLAVVTNAQEAPSAIVASSGRQLHLVFEWFRWRTFAPTRTNAPAGVLVVWLDDDLIQDRPLERMAMLGKSLVGDSGARLSVLGPRRSSTLRAMMGGVRFASTALQQEAESVLSNLTFYLTTASVMDEVLVGGVSNQPPRAAVRKQLRAAGVKDFVNFTATDAEIAATAFDELRLRGVDLTKTNQHLVLVEARRSDCRAGTRARQ